MRIVSLLPSATEMICVLGLGDQLVGVTHECDHPASISGLPIVTRTLIPRNATSAEIDALVRERARERIPLYQLDLPTLLALSPDLIVTQRLCDVCAVDETEVLRAACMMPSRPKVLNLEPLTLDGVFKAIEQVAQAARVPERGYEVTAELQQRVDDIVQRTHGEAGGQADRPTVVFLEWLDPLFCGGHWNPELVERAGGHELIGQAGERSRRISWAQLCEADPEVLFIACCGFGVQRMLADLPAITACAGWEKLQAVRDGRVYIADGSSYFNRPGPRLVESLEILAHCLHPALVGSIPSAIHYHDEQRFAASTPTRHTWVQLGE